MRLLYTFEMLDKRQIGLQLLLSFYDFSSRWEQIQHTSSFQEKSQFQSNNSPKNVPNTLIILVGMPSYFEAFFYV